MQKRWGEVSGPKSKPPPTKLSDISPATAKAPAISIARNKRAIGRACPTLVPKAVMTDSNATRDVTSLLAKCGMAMRVDPN